MRNPNEICLTGNNSTNQSASTHETGIFSWTNAVRMYNAMPLAITPCENVYEAKMYTAALLGVLSIAFLPLLVGAWFVYASAKKGGRR